jgi:hypothetical protein
LRERLGVGVGIVEVGANADVSIPPTTHGIVGDDDDADDDNNDEEDDEDGPSSLSDKERVGELLAESDLPSPFS